MELTDLLGLVEDLESQITQLNYTANNSCLNSKDTQKNKDLVHIVRTLSDIQQYIINSSSWSLDEFKSYDKVRIVEKLRDIDYLLSLES